MSTIADSLRLDGHTLNAAGLLDAVGQTIREGDTAVLKVMAEKVTPLRMQIEELQREIQALKVALALSKAKSGPTVPVLRGVAA